MLNLRTVLLLASPLLLCACAGIGGGSSASAEPQYDGIQTRSIHSAPETRQAENESRPLSELDTPDAIAAREAAARSAAATGAASSVATKPAQPAPAKTAVAAAAPAATTTPAGLQKGSKVRLRDGATLRARPSQGSDAVTSPAGAEFELGPQIYNAGGYWWYVTAGKDSGWLSQADLVR